MACPFFLPLEKFENGAWPHPARLPLGCGWSGQCTAPGHEGVIPDAQALQELCNLGYAHQCRRLPTERPWDSVRFAVASQKNDLSTAPHTISIRYICEQDHHPVEHGILVFDTATAGWTLTHSDVRVQRMAECFLESCLARNSWKSAVQPAN